MASSIEINENVVFNNELKQTTHTFVLLGVHIHINMNSIIQTKQSSTEIKSFSDDKICENYIKDNTTYQLILIVSGQLGQKIVPRIHEFKQVVSIYVYCRDKSTNEKWSCNFSKVRYDKQIIL
jgi:hypothetical protein